MTAPEDPFRTPEQGPQPGDSPGGQQYSATEHGAPPAGGSQPGAPSYGAPQYGAPQYGAPQYGAPQYGGSSFGGPGGPHAAPKRNGLGIAALVLGILALLTGAIAIGGLFGLVAIVLGVMGRGRVKRGEADNGGMALAGIILGVLGLLLSVLVVAGLATFFGSETFSNFTECVEQAGGDAAAQRACEAEFGRQIS